jgi:hypothetical protein
MMMLSQIGSYLTYVKRVSPELLRYFSDLQGTATGPLLHSLFQYAPLLFVLRFSDPDEQVIAGTMSSGSCNTWHFTYMVLVGV